MENGGIVKFSYSGLCFPITQKPELFLYLLITTRHVQPQLPGKKRPRARFFRSGIDFGTDHNFLRVGLGFCDTSWLYCISDITRISWYSKKDDHSTTEHPF